MHRSEFHAIEKDYDCNKHGIWSCGVKSNPLNQQVYSVTVSIESVEYQGCGYTQRGKGNASLALTLVRENAALQSVRTSLFEVKLEQRKENSIFKQFSTKDDIVSQASHGDYYELQYVIDIDCDHTIKIKNFRCTISFVIDDKANGEALNDSSRIQVDRLGFSPFAKAMKSVLHRVDTPVCVGLYGRWGTGKSVLIDLLKNNFDVHVSRKRTANELLQWFEKGWTRSTVSKRTDDSNSSTSQSIHWVYKLNPMRICGYLLELIVPEDSYDILLFLELFRNIFQDLYQMIRGSCCKFPRNEIEKEHESKKKERNHSCREYVFVDFNAWEFSQSDDLWAGLIRNLYNKVELRLKKHDNENMPSEYKAHPKTELEHAKTEREHANTEPAHFKPEVLNKQEKEKKTNWKRIWRVKKAINLLTEKYGGINRLRFRLLILLVLVLGIIATIVLSVLGFINIWDTLVKGVSNILSIVAYVVALVALAVPSFKFLYSSSKSVNTSRGDAIFQEANRVQDQIGFLSRVRGELDELFQFMQEFKSETCIDLILVIFVDDLDRCLDDRNVKMLESIQLLLAIPGAPVIIFLAIDSRVVVASIEKTINESFNSRDALITGYEYMDKIVQLPFCIPDIPREKIHEYVDNCIFEEAIPMEVKKALIFAANSIMDDINSGKERNRLVMELRYGVPENGRVSADKFLEVMEPFMSEVLTTRNAEECLLKVGKVLTTRIQDLVRLCLQPAQPEYDQLMERLCKEIISFVQNVNLRYFDEEWRPNPIVNPIFSEQVNTDIENPKEKSGDNSENKIKKTFEENIEQMLQDLRKSPLLPLSMSCTLKNHLALADANPRQVKRILNVSIFAFEVAKCKPLTESNSLRTIVENNKWSDVSAHLAKWILLCELYPFRMSFLVQLIQDIQQKMKFNNKDSFRREGLCYANIRTGNETKLKEQHANTDTHDDCHINDISTLSIGKFFYKYVDKYLHILPSSQKLLQLDSNPELFTSLIFLDFVITCADVGPADDQRTTFLSYSFNLDPSIAKQIALELQELVTPYELIQIDEPNSYFADGRKVRRKKSLFTNVRSCIVELKNNKVKKK